MKKIILFTAIIFTAVYSYAQQIPKIGIINYSKVVSSFSGDSRSLQEIERMIKSYEEGVNSIKNDISSLDERRLYYLNTNDELNTIKMEEQINKRKEYLREYSRIRLAAIEEKKSKLTQSTGFLMEIVEKIERVAEAEGYSIIFNSRDPDIIWWSHSVDITDLVIERLK